MKTNPTRRVTLTAKRTEKNNTLYDTATFAVDDEESHVASTLFKAHGAPTGF